jgi:hypothetical protein
MALDVIHGGAERISTNGMNTSQREAIETADAHLNNVGLPPYSDLRQRVAELEAIASEVALLVAEGDDRMHGVYIREGVVRAKGSTLDLVARARKATPRLEQIWQAMTDQEKQAAAREISIGLRQGGGL